MTPRSATLRRRALELLADPVTHRSVSSISATLGVSTRTLARWRTDPAFVAELAELQADHAPAESDGTSSPMPTTTDDLIGEAMRELRGIALDSRTAAYSRVNAWRAVVELVIEHRAVVELREQIAELRGGR